MSNVIIVGGGLAGLSAAHTILQSGGNVVVIDKCAFLGGNSTKATSGINGAGTSTQAAHGISDSRETFYDDIAKSAGEGLRPELVKVLAYESGPAIEWLMDDFELDLTRVARLGAHSNPRTHRGDGGRFPGAMITMTLMEKFDDVRDNTPERARLISKANVTELISDGAGNVIGCRFEKDGQILEEHGPVILSTGGFGADFSPDSLLADVYEDWKGLKAWDDVPNLPNLLTLPTTNGDHCTGDGIKLGISVGAGTVDMEAVQVHPTGMVMTSEPDAKVKFLAAEALRGQGGILLDANGSRFCDDVGKRDYVSSMMWRNKGPFRLCLNSKAAKDMEWHCKHYESRGLMKHLSGEELAAEIGVSVQQLADNLEQNNAWERDGNDPWGKKYFTNGPTTIDDSYFVAQVTPVVHYTMGGLHMDDKSRVLTDDGTPITGLYCAGEVMGGVHGKNRLGGNSLLDCVVYGRVSGREASKYMLSSLLSGAVAAPNLGGAAGRIANIGQHIDPAGFGVTITQGGVSTTVSVSPGNQNMALDISWGDGTAPVVSAVGGGAAAEVQEAVEEEAPGPDPNTEIPWEEVKKHTAEDDCWLVVEGKVYQLEEFLPDHPGGKKAPLIYAGKDATEEFMMLHKPELLEKYAKQYQIGVVSGPDPGLL